MYLLPAGSPIQVAVKLMKTSNGFSLIELVVGLIIVSILLVITTASMTEYVRNNQIRSLADELQTSLQQTKHEAIKRNARVNLLLTGTGWSIQVPAIDNQPAVTLLQKAVLNMQTDIAINPATATIGFNSQGRLSGGGNFSAEITGKSISDCQAQGGKIRCLRLQVSSAGQIKLCDPSLSGSDPRSC